MTKREKILTTIAVMLTALLVTTLYAQPANAAIELGITHQQIDFDEKLGIEDKGLSGASVGFAGEHNTLRFSYTGGDMWTSGENNYAQSLRMDLEHDLFHGKMRPYLVAGLGHFNLGTSAGHISNTYASAGVGVKLDLTSRLRVAADIRSSIYDREQQDNGSANMQLTYTLSESKAKSDNRMFIPDVRVPVDPVVPTKLEVHFPHDSYYLSPIQKQAIATYLSLLIA